MAEPTVWMPIVIGDHLAETSDFDATEQGAYCNLLFRLWRCDGLLPPDDRSLAKIARVSPKQWTRMRRTVLRLFVDQDGGYRHARMQAELDNAKANVEKKRQAGIASGAARRANTCSTDVRTSVQHMMNPSPSPSTKGEEEGSARRLNGRANGHIASGWEGDSDGR